MIAEFALGDVKRAPAQFDERKMQATNSEYLRALAVDDFVERSQAWLRARWEQVAPLVQERARTLGEVYAMADFLYLPEPSIDPGAWDKEVGRQPAFASILDGAVERLGDPDLSWTVEALQEAVAEVGEAVGVTNRGRAQAPIRLAVTGKSVGPPLFDSLAVLGRDRTLARLRAARARLA
jgi:glutamyl-tRNA synthetase